MSKIKFVPVFVLLALGAAGTAFAGTSSAVLPNGANLSVSLDSPLTSTEYLITTGETGVDVPISGTASVGLGDPDVTLVYVIDVSDSTSLAADGPTACGGDMNSDGGSGQVLDCEIAAVLNLNQAAIAGGSVDLVGVAVYGEGGAAADMTPGGADDPLTAPDANGDLASVVTSVHYNSPPVGSVDHPAGVAQFTHKDVGGDATDFSAGVAAATSIVSSPANTNGTTLVIFLSDGESNQQEGAGFASALAALQGTGAIIQAFAVGTDSSCGGGIYGTLNQIDDDSCEEVDDATQLPLVLPDVISTSLDAVSVTVDGNPLSVTTSVALPAPGAIGITWEADALDLGPGDHEVCVTATGHDVKGSTTTDPACETFHVYQLSAAPDGAINELGTPGQTHTVTATLAGPLAGLAPVGGRNINFSILSGPNASVPPFVGVTDAAGMVDFTYTATQGNVGLGLDTIEVCVTLNDPLGETGCVVVTKEWVDTTPPEASCEETANPSGGNTPKAGDKNQDGFYILMVTDAVDDDPQIYVVTGGVVFGPFPGGTTVKYTEAPGKTPSIKPMSGDVDYHIIGPGDMLIYGQDFSGNQSDPITCFVPPPPK